MKGWVSGAMVVVASYESLFISRRLLKFCKASSIRQLKLGAGDILQQSSAQFTQSGQREDLDEAITLQREALAFCAFGP